MTECETCCGFGGLFSVKYPDISNAMVEKKTSHAAKSGADLLLAGDLGCLMNMAGKLSRANSPVVCRHVAEVLAGEMSVRRLLPRGIEAMTAAITLFKGRVGDALLDTQLQTALSEVPVNLAGNRAKAKAALPEFEALRDSPEISRIIPSRT